MFQRTEEYNVPNKLVEKKASDDETQTATSNGEQGGDGFNPLLQLQLLPAPVTALGVVPEKGKKCIQQL